ncbi:TRAP transporter substrate-binding protein DctP [Acidimangrovimonas sediminis]|uniref:TRAP transporter substrate-binding protein DctP n=1 Tax=Acidimangrovimonas sediminis TaxID=2056283 RepID=UPI0013049676|nr:TRAP transporter substrate-binding protein DctP [Acidimangrovimonas sediminis]
MKTLPLLAAALSGLVALGGPALAAEQTINAVTFVPAQNSFAVSFMKFVKEVNEKGKGIVHINVRGGPEVIPSGQQGDAQKSGLIDMIETPAGLYLNLVPEGEAFAASTKSPEAVRANGGWDLMQKIYAKKGNAHLLAHIDSGAGFNIFTVDKPVMTADGGIDWTKLKIRASPLYRTFFTNLGTTVIVQSQSEVYTSLERGVVNATAYPIQGFHNYGWDKFVKYRVDPSFFQTDVLISMNLKKWNSLSPEAQKILTDVSIGFEKESRADTIAETKKEGDAMIAAGQTVVTLTGKGKAEFLDKAAAASWERMEKRDPTYIPQLKKFFTQ